MIERGAGHAMPAVLTRLPAPFRQAWSGPVRYWQDRSRVAVKGALAAVAAWALARYAAGQADPYFAPLAALLGVYPTVARSFREVVTYVGGFVLGAALAIPVGVALGPSLAGIGVVVLAGMLLGSWRLLGDQSMQVTFTALFALLLGGHQPLHYVTHRSVDVAIGVLTGLAINILIFPPLQLRPAEHAIRQWGCDIADALAFLATAADTPPASERIWRQHDRQLTVAADQARRAASQARESLRWNPRAKAERSVPRPDGTVVDALDAITARTRAIARTLLDRPADDVPASFGPACAAVLRALTVPVRQLADLRSPRPHADLANVRASQRQLEARAPRSPGGDQPSPEAHLARLSCDVLRELAGPPAAASGATQHT